MTDLIERLRIYAGQNYDSSVSFDASELCHEAADEIERLQSGLARHVDRVCTLTAERDALRARIEGAPFARAELISKMGGVRCNGLPIEWVGKRVALIRLECE